MNIFTPAQRRALFPPGTQRYEAWSAIRHIKWRIRHKLCFHKHGVRRFVRCRCGRHAVAHVSTNVDRTNVYKRWFCGRHAAAFDDAERRAGRRW
jgi:hypothetical protein